jgi:nucleoside-diphosphate-sugar epimerase
MSVVLITAATTPVGGALTRALLDDDRVEHVIAVGIEEAPHDQLPLGDDRLTYERFDLTRERNIRRMLFGTCRDLSATHVVHTAPHRSATDRGARVRRLNVDSTRHLIRLCERHPSIRRFIYKSYAEVYRHDHHHPTLIAEDQPLELTGYAPQRVRDRVEADLTVCTHMGMSDLSICVLRLAEVFAPHCGSQLWDWLQSSVCFRPLGYNPMVNLLSVDDAVRAMQLAVHSDAQGVFNVPGRDTLPIKMLAEHAGARVVPVPGPVLSPMYRARARARGTQFRYDMNRGRFHTSDLLDGRRASLKLGYEPSHPISFAAL